MTPALWLFFLFFIAWAVMIYTDHGPTPRT